MELANVDIRPLYLQVAEVLKRYLDEGDFKAGNTLPAVQTLANQLGISRSTLANQWPSLSMRGA